MTQLETMNAPGFLRRVRLNSRGVYYITLPPEHRQFVKIGDQYLVTITAAPTPALNTRQDGRITPRKASDDALPPIQEDRQ